MTFTGPQGAVPLNENQQTPVSASAKSRVIMAESFKSRSDLENHVRNALGLTTELKSDVEIVGTREELAVLGLSDRTIFWGITCRITDEPTLDQIAGRVDRVTDGVAAEVAIKEKGQSAEPITSEEVTS